MRIAREEALQLGDLNLASYMRHVNEHAPGGALEEGDGLLLVAGSHPNPQPYVNGVLRTDERLGAREVLDRAEAFFGARRRGYALWIRDHADAELEQAAREAGYWQRPPLEGQPGIFIDRVPAAEPVPGLRRVEGEAEARAFLSLVGEVYGMAGSPEELVWAMFLRPEALLSPRVVAVVAWNGDDPLAGAMIYNAGPVAGLYWAVRSDRARGRGLGAACAAAVVEAGLAQGAHLAVGQGSARGTPLWNAAGWETLTHYRRYLAPPPRQPPGRG